MLVNNELLSNGPGKCGKVCLGRRNLHKLCNLARCELNQLTARMVKNDLRYFEIPDSEVWRVPLLQELLSIRKGELDIANLDSSEISQLIVDICTY